MAEGEREIKYTPTFSTDFSTLQREREREREFSERDRAGAEELWEAAKENEWLGPRLGEQSQFATDPQSKYQVPQKRLEKLGLEYDQKELDFIAQANSQEDEQARIEKVQEDRRRNQLIASEGIRGIGYSMLAGMTDPALLPLYIGTGGAGAVGRAGVLAKALRSGAAGAAEGAAIEAVLASTDTQRDWTDVVLGGIGGGVISGAIPLGAAGFKRLRKGQPADADVTAPTRDPEAFEAANSADSDMAKWTRDYREDQAIKAMEDQVSIQSLQSVDQRQAVIDELMPIAANRMSRGERNPLLAEQSKLRNEIEMLRQRQADEPPVGTGGTQRQRQRAAEQRNQRIQHLESRIRPLQQRIDEVDRTIEEDMPAREAWADISRLSQGQIPERFRERIEKGVQEAKAPYDREESRRVRELAEQAQRAREQRAEAEADAAVRSPEGEGEEAGESTVGAARVQGATNPEDVYPEAETGDVAEQVNRMARVADNLPDNDRLRRMAGMGTKRLKSSYSRLRQSVSPAVRGMAHTLLADPQQAARGHIPASVRKANNLDRLHAVEGGREADARAKWAQAHGINPISMLMGEGNAAREFDDTVVLEIRGVDSGDEFIKQAAQARRELLDASLKMRKEAGERGFEEVESHDAYWSFLPEFHKMQTMTARHGKEAVIETLTGAYMNGRFRLRERTARLVAKATYARTMNRGLVGSEDRAVPLSNRDIETIRADMEELGVDTQRIDDFIEEMNDIKEQESISNRAKLSLGASISYQSPTGIRTIDLIDTRKEVAEQYAEEASAGAALARSGFKSRGEAERTIAEIERNAENILTPDGRDRTKEEQQQLGEIKQNISELRDSLKVMYGESLDVGGNGRTGSWVKLSRAARKSTNLVALQWNGFASMGEASNQIVNLGLMTTLRNTRIKDFASFGRIRQSEDLQGMYKLIGAYGQFGSSIRDNNYTIQTMDEYDQSKLERIFNNTTGWVSNKSQIFSGFRSVQHGLENVAARSMQDRLVRIAEGKITPSQRDFDNMERSGLSRDQIDQVLQHIRDNPEYVRVDGEQVRVFSGNGMDPELREDLSAAMTSMLSRNMQRSFVGETPIWMSKEIGKMLTQFRSFGMVAVEKQLAAGLRGDKIGMFLKSMFGLTIGAGAYYSRLWIRAQGQDDPEEYWEKYTDPAVAVTGISNMTPHLGLMGMGLELGHISGVIDSDGASVASRSGNRPLTVEGMIPAAGVASEGVTALRDLVGGVATADGEATGEALKDLYGTMPIMNSAAIGTAIALANSASD